MKTMNKRPKLIHPSKKYNKAEPFFPYEIIYGILIRVPARDLVSFKRVCKSWKEIIGSREFSTAHLKHWKSRFDIILLQGLFPYHDYVSLNIRTKTTHQMFLRNLAQEDCLIVLDSLDGLILFRVTYHDELYICNPVTQKLKLIFCVRLFYKPFRTFYKLVFDPELRKYKIIGFYYKVPECNVNYIVVVLNGDDDDNDKEASPIWRNVETRFQHLLKIEFTTVSINGLLCWLAHSICESIGDRVVYVQAMEVVGEKFKEKLMLPCQPRDGHSANCNLIPMENVEGSLCVAIPEDQHELGIWILKDWDEQIWVKKYHIYNDQPLHFSKRFSFLFLMDCDEAEEEKFIVRISGKLCSYSLKGRPHEENSEGSPIFTYVPTLICWA